MVVLTVDFQRQQGIMFLFVTAKDYKCLEQGSCQQEHLSEMMCVTAKIRADNDKTHVKFRAMGEAYSFPTEL